jgi:hypothetical protein
LLICSEETLESSVLAIKLSKKPENKFSDLISCNYKNSKPFLAVINTLRI